MSENWWAIKLTTALTPSSLLQVAKTTTHLLSFMRPDLSFFSFSAARHTFSP